MHFLDEAKIYLRSGDGGNGCVSFRREKFVAEGGPNGGDGGRGGSIIFRANSHLNTLVNFRYKQHFKAKAGESGKGQNCNGKSGDDLILEVPVGTQIFSDDANHLLFDFTEDESEFKILPGGKGGLGNSHFKSSITQAPTRSIPGAPGEEMWVWLKLKLISDIGIIGLPNAGKSTFLSVISNAKPKIADYPFTTLVPNLGVAKINDDEIVLADIPGLIEGAHLGLGLGHRFLKHIERCASLLHLIDASSDDVVENYLAVRNELEEYSEILKNKKEVICLNKIDLLTGEELEEKIRDLYSVIIDKNQKIYTTSSWKSEGVYKVLDELHKIKLGTI